MSKQQVGVTEQPKIRPSHKKMYIWLAVVSLFLIGLVGFYAHYRFTLKQRLQISIAAMKALDIPMSLTELNRDYHKLAMPVNAADKLNQAFALFRSKDEEFQKNEQLWPQLPVVGIGELPEQAIAPLPAEQKQAIAAYLTAQEATIALLIEGIQMGHCRYPVDWTQGLQALLPHLSPVQATGKLLVLAAIFHAEEHRPDQAAAALAHAIKLSQTMDTEPALISLLVKIAGEGTIFATGLPRVLAKTSLSEQSLTMLLALFSPKNEQRLFRTFAGEVCMGSDIFTMVDDPDRVRQLLGNNVPFSGIYRLSGVWEQDFIWYLDLMGDYLRATQEPIEKRAAAALVVGSRLSTMSKSYIISSLIIPTLGNVIIKDSEAIARQRCAVAVLGIEKYRLAAGNLPDKIEAIVPAQLPRIPLDPFDAKPLRYKKLAHGYIVYSIGHDLKDDGGNGEKNPTGDYKDVAIGIER